MSDPVLELPYKESYWLVRFLWGDSNFPSTWRMTNANEDLIALAGLFEATPLLNVRAPANTGTFDGKTWSFDVPVQTSHLDFLNSISNGRAQPPISCTAWEYSLDDDGNVQILTHLQGSVTKLIRNPEGRQQLARFEVLTIKNDIKRPMGVSALGTCQWTFGDAKTCGFTTLESLVETGSLDSVSGLTATITGLSTQRDRYWHRGYIRKDGIRILIKEWVQGDDFVLSKLIPREWEANLPLDVQVVPGCDKLPRTCELWERLFDSFSGWGSKTPDYNPSMGVGDG